MTLARLFVVFTLLLTGTALAVHAYVDHMRPRQAGDIAALAPPHVAPCAWMGPSTDVRPCERLDAPASTAGERACAALGEPACDRCPRSTGALGWQIVVQPASSASR